MQNEEEDLDSHVIELGDTRPVMARIPFVGFLGEIPLHAAIVVGALGALCFNFGGIKWAAWFPFAWWLISRLVINNAHGLTHAQRYIDTGMVTCLDRKAQGGVSVTPFPQIKGKNRGMT